MGSLFINVGQCGNQIGLQLMDYLEQQNNLYDDSFTKRSEQNIIHSILIDTEPKILRSVVENKKRYPFIDNKNVLYFQHGRGNNWALGYMDQNLVQKRKSEKLLRSQNEQIFSNGKYQKDQTQTLTQIIKQAPQQEQKNMLMNDNYLKENSQIIEDTLQCIRKEIEKIDYFIGINMLSSLGGGTGSGLGSRLVQEFKDMFSDATLVNTVVFPSKSGENTLQHYNSILSLSQLQAYSDCIIYFSNDKINNYLGYQKSKSLEKSVDITNINQYIASQLNNMVRINDSSSYDRFYFDLLTSTAPVNDFKFLEIYSSPYFFDKQPSSNQQTSWEKLTDIVCGQVNIEDGIDDKHSKDNKNPLKNQFQKNFKKNTSLFVNSLFKSQDVVKSLKQQTSLKSTINQKLSNTFNPVSWNPDASNIDFIEYQPTELTDNKMMLTMANTTHISGLIQDISETAYNKFKANAFLHWYYKYDLEHSDFQHAFNTMDNIVENYNSLL